MLPVFLVGGLSGCSMPFAILMVVAIASLFLSVVISAEDMPTSSQSVRRSSPSISRHLTKNTAFVHHNTAIKTQRSYLKPLRMGDDLLPIVTRVDRQSETLSEPINHLNKPTVSKHYACPPTSIDTLRKRYGKRQSLWGEWSNAETRAFYRTQLPRALQIDGALGLTLEERAQLASEARHALRVYSRERCYLPGRVAARIYDGIRHFQLFGYWSCDGMNWTEVKEKYARDARAQIGEDAAAADIEMFVYRKIVDRACATNAIFDHYASQGSIEHRQLLTLITGIFAIEKLKLSRPPRRGEKAIIIEELEKQLEDERSVELYARQVPYNREDAPNFDITLGSINSLSMSISLPKESYSKLRSRTLSGIILSLPQNFEETFEEIVRMISQIVSIALGKGEQLRYLIASKWI